MELQRDHEGVAVKTMEAALADVIFVELLIKVAAFWAEFGGDADELRVRGYPLVRVFLRELLYSALSLDANGGVEVAAFQIAATAAAPSCS